MNSKTHDDPSGILIVDKEKNMTSHDVVDMVRKRFGIKKVGHAGTLDPNATGVLVLLLGKATKLSQDLSGEDKEYIAMMKLGEKTTSGDSTGEITAVKRTEPTVKSVKDVITSFIGETEQIPPMVSAKKVNGQRLYKLARKGIEIERKPNKINIMEIEILGIDIPLVEFRVLSSKGTYIRQLAEDIGEKLGCGAHLTELRRTRSGNFSLEAAVSFSDLMKMDKETLNENITRVQGSKK
ncbi:MAG: tRNA pseudouridine(55) synthase TruB [Candidatus Omnitrophica bacterium]|nr:tRNA pseudouridine(55) synthase TruB [Candidatus Omnitrophota bacterium]